MGTGRKRARRLLRLSLILLLLATAWTVYVQARISSAAGAAPNPADAAIVLGAALWSDVPSPGLKERLERAIRLYREGTAPRLIVTGGLDRNGSTLTEAEGMKRYLLEHGVPEDRIYTEPEARNTLENLKFSKAIMDAHGWNSCIVVTHDYHGARAVEMARAVGLAHVQVATTGSRVMNMTWHRTRETLAYTKWEAQKLLLRLGVWEL